MSDDDLRIAVVVATFNRPERLRRLLDALATQTLDPADFEVIAVDDASPDPETTQVLEREEGAGRLRLRRLRMDVGGGPGVARERGWRASGARMIAFTDDDCEPDPGWLEALLAALDDRGDRFVQGRTAPNPAERALLDRPFARTIEITELTTTFNTCNLAFPRGLMEQLGGFDTDAFRGSTAGEDTDLAWRAIAAGAEPHFAADALVYHAVDDLGVIGALRTATRWAASVRPYARHPALRRERLVHGVFWKHTHLWLLRAALALLLPRRWWSLPVAMWLVLPYARSVRGRALAAGHPELVAFLPLHDLLEVATVVRGAIRERTPIV